MEILVAMVRAPDEFEAVFANWAKARVGAVIIQPSLPRNRAIEFALKHQFVSASPSVAFAAAGGLFGYAANVRDVNRKIAHYVDRVLKGAKPADMPLELPTVFELAVNLRTARALGVTIPPALLFRADQVIE
jgi:putative ABC transport system substrate-binding protein